MAGHSQFKNIMHRKGAQDQKRAKIFTKIAKEITVAVKIAGEDPNSNPRLRTAISEAREVNMPKDNVERAIKKAIGSIDLSNYEEIRYEGYSFGGVAIIVEALTDNRNRTASEVRAVFTKNKGSLGESGGVSFLFKQQGLIKINKLAFNNLKYSFNNLFEACINYNVDDVIEEDDNYLVITTIKELHTTSDKIFKQFLLKETDITYNIVWHPQHLTTIDNLDTATLLIKLINALEDLDDVQKVYANYDIPEDIITKL